MTATEVSDLKSLIERRVQVELDLRSAELVAKEAKYQLANFLWRLEQGKKAESA